MKHTHNVVEHSILFLNVGKQQTRKLFSLYFVIFLLVLAQIIRSKRQFIISREYGCYIDHIRYVHMMTYLCMYVYDYTCYFILRNILVSNYTHSFGFNNNKYYFKESSFLNYERNFNYISVHNQSVIKVTSVLQFLQFLL